VMKVVTCTANPEDAKQRLLCLLIECVFTDARPGRPDRSFDARNICILNGRLSQHHASRSRRRMCDQNSLTAGYVPSGHNEQGRRRENEPVTNCFKFKETNLSLDVTLVNVTSTSLRHWPAIVKGTPRSCVNSNRAQKSIRKIRLLLKRAASAPTSVVGGRRVRVPISLLLFSIIRFFCNYAVTAHSQLHFF